MGQQKVKPSTEWNRLKDAYVKTPEKWNKDNENLMSFELWCVATGYDPTKTDGGAAFQQLLHFLLVNGSAPFTGNDLSTKYYTHSGRGSNWLQGNPHDRQLASLNYNLSKKEQDEIDKNEPNKKKAATLKAKKLAELRNKQIHSPVTQGAYKKRGGGLGHLSGDFTGFKYAKDGSTQNAQAKSWAVSTPRAPCSKLNWLQSISSKQLQSQITSKSKGAPGKKFTNASEVSFASDGEGKNCIELDGCMQVANLTAAIIGLYFYPDCDNPKHNWTVTQTTDIGTYTVRMRMWNPAYHYLENDSRLLVKEPLNSKAIWSYGAKYGPRVVGGYTASINDTGFVFPDIFKEKGKEEEKYPVEPLTIIKGRTDARTRLAPFFGVKEPTSGNIGTQSDSFRNSCIALNKLFPNLVHKPDEEYGGAFFGFNVPKAHWLYPHYVLDGDDLSEGTYVKGKHKTTKELYTRAHQLWPTWKYTSTDERTEAISKSNDISKFYQLFNDPNLDKMTKYERRAYALRDEDETIAEPQVEAEEPEPDEPELNEAEPDEGEAEQPDEAEPEASTSAPPSNVQQVQVPKAPPAPPTDNLGEQTQDSAPMESNGNGTNQDNNDAVRRENALDIGFVKDSALNLESRGSLLENEGLGYDIGAEDDAEKLRKKFNTLAGFHASDRTVKQLQPGSARSNKDLNPHWYSARHQPWPHSDLYIANSITLDVAKPMGNDKLKEYEARYGSTHNLYLRGETIPKEVKGVKHTYGDAKPYGKTLLIHTSIAEGTKLHNQHMCRILAIYFYDGDIGKDMGKHAKITYEDKEAGMLGGIWGKHTATNQQNVEIHYGRPKGKNVEKEWKCLWPAVFERKPDTRWASSFKLEEHMRGENNELHDCMIQSKLSKIRQVKSKMTVLQWVTSPWHYAFLPYQVCTALFEDGETYAEGCKRCSRPFFEFKYMYAWFRLSAFKTQHWPTSYWHVDNPIGLARAPVPFHYEDFWSDEQSKASGIKQDTSKVKGKTIKQNVNISSGQPRNVDKSHLGKDEDGGWHNWPTFDFPIATNSLLKGEFHKRKATLQQGGDQAIMSKIAKNQPLVFRRYINHVYNEDRIEFWLQDDYPKITQGRLTNGKVKFGMRDYMLMRSSKYGNTCKDCAAVLELAPGLFHRNHRTVFDVGMVVGNSRMHETTSTWWTNLIGRVGPRDGMYNFDPDFLQTSIVNGIKQKDHKLKLDIGVSREEYVKAFNDSMEIYAKFLQEKQHKVPFGVRTKYKQPPDIYIQKTVFPEKKGAKQDYDLIKKAIMDLRTMLDKPRTEWDIDTANVAFRDMVYELERKYVHKDRFKWEGTTNKVFDSEMMRLEYRNVERIHPVSGRKYHNCLVIRTYNPAGPANGGLRARYKKDSAGNFKLDDDGEKIQEKDKDGNLVYDKPPEEDYTETVYYATRRGPMGKVQCDTEEPTQWCGDAFVTSLDKDNIWKTKRDKDKNNPDMQWRKMQQSRLFITYSLHTAVTTEIEGRVIMERMADAAHELFGNDINLSELLVFGYKLGGFGSQDPATDTISKAQFEIIKAPNKKDALPYFYGESGQSSYIYDTYETHVNHVELDGGIEIGPKRHHPHFHILLTINHWSYVQIDYFKMNAYLELMFKGLDPFHRGWGDRFKLPDNFYTDNESPYVDIKVYPQDNWADIISAYVRKNAVPGAMEALSARVEGARS